jgi:hypothetical protein
MDVFQEYKTLRNKIALLARDDALRVIWAYSQYLQINKFQLPNDIEVHAHFYQTNPPQTWISEWELELLAKEVLLNANLVASKGRTLRAWKTLGEILNLIKDLENRIYGNFSSERHVLVELIRIAHRQFIWQGHAPNPATAVRYFKIFDRPGINQICMDRLGLNVQQILMCGMACMGNLLDRPAINVGFTSTIRALPTDAFQKFFSISSRTLSGLNQILKAEQQYNENFAYAYNSLRAYPLVRMSYFGEEAFVCPIPTLLFWKITGGLYYELVDDPRFANEFGDAFQTYVGDVIECACPNPKIQRLAEQEYSVGKQRKRTVDWIVADEQAALFLECKVKRLAFGAKVSLTDLGPLEAEIDNMATAVVQIYKTISDYLDNRYSHFPVKQGRKIYPAVVTLENWHMFGPVMLTNLEEVVTTKLKEAALPPEWANEMRYSVWPVEELEVGLQIVNSVPIADFVDRKLNDPEMKRWAWHPYMTKCFSQHFPAKMLFLKEFDDIFANLLAAERLGN